MSYRNNWNWIKFKHSTNWLKQVLLVLVLLVAFGKNSRAELLDSLALDTVKTYVSLEEALLTPEKVYKLDLSKSKLIEFPSKIFLLKNLNVLNLSKNKMVVIPDSIAVLVYLQDITFSRNKIEEFPLGICELKHLKRLNMNRNLLVGIPSEIGELTELRVLDLWSNDLAHFPAELKNLENLEVLDLRGILINYEQQERLEKLLPNAKVEMDLPCKCGY